MPAAPELHESITALPSLLADVGPFLLVRDPIAWERSGAAAVLDRLDDARALFHDDCIMQWLTEQKNTCPSCMREFPRED